MCFLLNEFYDFDSFPILSHVEYVKNLPVTWD